VGGGGVKINLFPNHIEKISNLKDAKINNLTLQFTTRNFGNIWKKYLFFM
jgi:hypothetical protein